MTQAYDPRNYDSEGTLIEVGDIVAFNYSGNVARGVVEYLPLHQHIGAVTVAHVWPDGAYKGPSQYSKGVSHVRNRQSILVLAKVRA